VFVAAASRVSLPPVRCIVVEDAAAGVEAARRAGMRCVGVSRTERLDADVSASSLLELPADTFERLLARS
jgi:beta-phosphoglucomutase